MLGSINPLGERGRGSRWTVTIAWYVAGSMLAGGALGGVLASIGAAATSAAGLSADAAIALLAVVIAAAVAVDLGLLGSIPSRPRRQVNEEWLYRYRGWVYGLGFGFQLGLGFATVVSTGALYATFAAAFLSGSVARGAIIGATFGLIRASAVFSVAGVRWPHQLGLVDARLRRWDHPSRRGAVAVQLGLIAAAVVAALG